MGSVQDGLSWLPQCLHRQEREDSDSAEYVTETRREQTIGFRSASYEKAKTYVDLLRVERIGHPQAAGPTQAILLKRTDSVQTDSPLSEEDEPKEKRISGFS